MPLKPLTFRPGINREQTSYANEGGWRDCNLIRWRRGRPEKWKGWSKYMTTALTGICRSMHTWADLDKTIRTGLGTHKKFQLEEGGVVYDITPIRKTTNPMATDPFATTNGSAVVTVTDASHGALVGDYVTFSGSSTFGGFSSGQINAEFAITSIVDANTYTITMPQNANATDTTNGGASVVATYQINVGLADFVAGTGWGAGTWGSGTWGTPRSVTAGGEQMRLWSQDNYGEDLIINPRGLGLYIWDASGGTSTRATAVSALPGASQVPDEVNMVAVTENRQVMAYGCTDIDTLVLDPMLIRWTDEEDAGMWTPDPSNSAGGQRLGVGSEILTAIKGRQETLVMTNSAVYSQRYVGAPAYWSFDMLTPNVSIIGPNAGILVDGVAYWMDRKGFYQYAGSVELIPCDVLRYVFDDINLDQCYKVTVGVNSAVGEVMWFYPSESSTENDRMVSYNYREKLWAYGALSRTCWEENGLRSTPLAVSPSGYVYAHESGEDDDGSAMNSWIESSDLDIGDGDQFWFITRLIPDFDIASGAVNIEIKSRRYPLQDMETYVTTQAENNDGQLDVRLRARQIAFKFGSNELAASWRLGNVRVDAREDGAA